MLKKIKNGKAIFIAVCLVGLAYACRKDFQSSEKQEIDLNDPSQKMDIDMAIKYYSQLKKEQGSEVKASNISGVGTNAKISSLKPLVAHNRKYSIFKKAYESQTDRSTLVEVPIVYDSRPSLVITDQKNSGETSVSDKKEIFKYSFDRLIIYKNKKTGKINHRLVTYIPSLDYLKRHKYKISHNQINKLDVDFTGFLEYKKWDGTGLYFLQYLNGKKIKYIPLISRQKKQQLGTNSSKVNSVSPMMVICSTYYIEEWGESCVGAGPEADTNQTCTPYLISSEEVTFCEDDGSDDGGGGDPGGGLTGDPCIDYGDCTGDPCIDYGDCDVPPPPIDPSPCAQKGAISSRAANATISAKNNAILAATTANNKEYGTEQNLQTLGTNDYKNTTVRTDNLTNKFTPNFSWNSTDGYTIGASHGHPGGSAPSPGDVAWIYRSLTNPELVAAGNSGIANYKSNVSVTTVTSNGTYVITVKNWAALQLLTSIYDSNPQAADQAYIDKGVEYRDNNLLTANNESETAYALLSIYGDAINIYKAPAGTTTFSPVVLNGVDVISTDPCL